MTRQSIRNDSRKQSCQHLADSFQQRACQLHDRRKAGFASCAGQFPNVIQQVWIRHEIRPEINAAVLLPRLLLIMILW
jgi:hypothetical protein